MTSCILSVALLFAQPVAPTSTVGAGPGETSYASRVTSPRPNPIVAATSTPLLSTEQLPAPAMASTVELTSTTLMAAPPPEIAQPVQPQQRNAGTPPADRADPAEQLVDEIFGWPGRQLVTCESHWDRYAIGRYGERGLFQIHPVHRPLIATMGYTWDDMFEVEPNIRVAVEIRRVQGLTAWTCWKAAA